MRGRSILSCMNQIKKWLWDAWTAIQPDVEAFLDKQFDKWMPKIIAAATVAMSQIGAKIANAALKAGAEGAENVADTITDFIPGDLDDRLADQFLGPIFDQFKNRGILPLTAQPPDRHTP